MRQSFESWRRAADWRRNRRVIVPVVALVVAVTFIAWWWGPWWPLPRGRRIRSGVQCAIVMGRTP